MKHWVALAAILAVSGCGDSGLNPFGWFGGQGEEVETLNDAQIVVVEDARPRVPTVTSLRIDRSPGGAIVRATGLPPVQGWHSAELVARGDGPVNGVLTLDFRAAPPVGETRTSTVQSRELVVGYPLSNIMLANIRTVRVVGASNALTTRR